MHLVHSTGALRRVRAAVAAAGAFVALALAIAMPARAQARPAPSAAHVSPRIHGDLLVGVFTIIDAPGANWQPYPWHQQPRPDGGRQRRSR
jgi:hypothetical protein